MLLFSVNHQRKKNSEFRNFGRLGTIVIHIHVNVEITLTHLIFDVLERERERERVTW